MSILHLVRNSMLVHALIMVHINKKACVTLKVATVTGKMESTSKINKQNQITQNGTKKRTIIPIRKRQIAPSCNLL